MSRLTKALIPFLCFFLLQSCPQDDDSIDNPDPEETELDEVTSELIFFNYTPQEGATPERLQYEIEFTNPNDLGVIGFYSITTISTFENNETLEFSLLSTNNSVCYEIPANSTCIFSFDEIGDINLGSAVSVEYVSASYTIDDTF